MGLFSKSKSKEELVAVFDIGSASIGGALVSIPRKGSLRRRPKIVYSIRYPIALQENLDFERFFTRMLEALREVAVKVKEASPAVPQKVICFLASPWYAAQMRMVKVRKNSPFVFTKRVAEDLIGKELRAFEKFHLKKYAERGDEARIIESKNIQVLLNGYKTNKPFGKKIKEVELALFISIASLDVLDALGETVKRFLNAPTVHFSSFLLPFFIVTRDLFADQEDFLLIDVGGEVTDISVIKNGVLKQALSFPLGKNFFIRIIAKDFKRSKEEASTLLSMYLSGHLEESLESKIDGIMQKAREVWLEHFQKSLVEISDNVSLPETIFLTADNDVTQWFAETIKKERFSQYILTADKFNVIVLEAKTLHSFCRFGRNTERDPFLILESIYLTRATASSY